MKSLSAYKQSDPNLKQHSCYRNVLINSYLHHKLLAGFNQGWPVAHQTCTHHRVLHQSCSQLQQHHSETHDLISGTPAVCRQDHRMSSTYYSYTIATHLGELISIHAYTGWDLIMIGENAQMKGAKYETSWHMLTEIVQPKNRMEHFPLTHCVSF